MRTYEETLPEGYVTAKTVDAADKKFGMTVRTVSLAVTASVAAASYFIIRPRDFFHNFDGIVILIILSAAAAYLLLHELVHGAAYWLLTRRKLKFGVTAAAAYCGVPDVYVYRSCALTSLFAPLAVFIAAFGGAAAVLENEWHKFFAAVLLAYHLGGCVGDIYNMILLLFRFRDRSTLMRDTGPKQIFYVKK